MKKQVLLFFICFLTLQFIHAQSVNFLLTVTNASSDSSCDGKLDIQCIGCIQPIDYSWYDSIGNIVGTSSLISGLCNNSYYIVVIESNTSELHQFAARINDTTQSGATFQLTTSLNYATDNTNNHLIITQVSGGIAPYTYQLSAYLFGTNTLVNSDTASIISNLIFNDLSPIPDGANGYYRFNISDAINYKASYFFSLSQNLFYNPNGSLYASAQGTPVSDSTACDGYAFTEVYGGTPPYTYQYSSGSISDTASGLCPGSYILTVTDANGNELNTSFVIGYPNTYYFSDGGTYNYLDTLYSNALQDCGIDYTLPIDSFYIDSSYAISNWEYVVNWTIIQGSNEFLFTEIYFIDSTGYYYFGLSLYCDARSSSFGSYTFFSGAYADMSTISTQIETISNDEFISVYPNPSNGIFAITSSKKMTSYSIFDALGRKVSTKTTDSNTQSVDIQALNVGMYYLIAQFDDGTIGKQKIMKK